MGVTFLKSSLLDKTKAVRKLVEVSLPRQLFALMKELTSCLFFHCKRKVKECHEKVKSSGNLGANSDVCIQQNASRGEAADVFQVRTNQKPLIHINKYSIWKKVNASGNRGLQGTALLKLIVRYNT